MPSKSKKQAKFMRAVAHGWKPTRSKGPSPEVAREFVRADKRTGKYAAGGPVVALAAAGQGIDPGRRMMGSRPNVRAQAPLQALRGTGMPGRVPNGALRTARDALRRGRDGATGAGRYGSDRTLYSQLRKLGPV
jgi:hypothetical protein